MFTSATKNFGVWKEERRNNKISYSLSSMQFVVALSIVSFVVFITLILVAKIRQEFFLVEASPATFFQSHIIDKTFLINERNAALSIFIKKDNNNIHIYFDNGQSFILPFEVKEFSDYLEKRKNNIIFTSMLLRLNGEFNSRVKVWTAKNIKFNDIRFVINIFSKYGFDSFDFGVEI
jgi:hypothetical protein